MTLKFSCITEDLLVQVGQRQAVAMVAWHKEAGAMFARISNFHDGNERRPAPIAKFNIYPEALGSRRAKDWSTGIPWDTDTVKDRINVYLRQRKDPATICQMLGDELRKAANESTAVGKNLNFVLIPKGAGPYVTGVPFKLGKDLPNGPDVKESVRGHVGNVSAFCWRDDLKTIQHQPNFTAGGVIVKDMLVATGDEAKKRLRDRKKPAERA